MFNSSVPKPVRYLIIISAAFLIASLGISGVNAYVTLAAPLNAPYVPDKVSFEGYLADNSGNPIADGNYDITFSLYDVSANGTPLWTEQQPVTVTSGLYSVQLGIITPLDPSHFEGERWLGIRVGTDTEMTPRIPVSAVPFALNARQAMGLQGRDVSANAPLDGEVLGWDAANEQWIPMSSAGSSGAELPSGTVLLMTGACPQGFVEYTAARGRYILGVPEGGAVEAVVGIALSDQENRPVGQHSHDITDPGHSHTYTYKNLNGGTAIGAPGAWLNTQTSNTGTSTTGITISDAGTVAGTNAPYIQLLLCLVP